MVESADRQSLVPFDLKHILDQVPELNKLNTRLDAVSFENPIDSSDMHPGHWTRMANMVADHYDHYDGFVVLHGSDTLAYSASALSFMLKGLQKPVILTGSQLPIGMIRTDARENLITAVEMATLAYNGDPVIREVAVYFEYKLYRGNRTKKVSTEAFEAFHSPNYPLLAEAGVHIEVNHQALWRSEDRFELNTNMDPAVGVLPLFPGIQPPMVKSILESPGLKGVVMQTFGAGNAMQETWFLELLSKAIERGMVILNLSQCTRGGVEQGKYATSQALLKMGVVGGVDMTLEAAIVKLMYLFGHEPERDVIREMLVQSMRGELSMK